MFSSTETEIDLQAKIEARQAALVQAAGPKAMATLQTAEKAAATAVSKAEQVRATTLTAVEQIGAKLRELGSVRSRLETLRGIEYAVNNPGELQARALNEFVVFLERNDSYSLARFTTGADEVSRLLAIAPALPKAIASAETEAETITRDIRATASEASIDLPKLLKKLREDAREHVDGVMTAHYEAGRLDL